MVTLIEALLSILAKLGLFFWQKHEAEEKQEEVAHVQEDITAMSDSDVDKQLRKYTRD
jgi:hypothetical protein